MMANTENTDRHFNCAEFMVLYRAFRQAKKRPAFLQALHTLGFTGRGPMDYLVINSNTY